jgi:hypothetical protein
MALKSWASRGGGRGTLWVRAWEGQAGAPQGVDALFALLIE